MCPCSGVGYRRRNWSTSQNLSLSVYIFLLATFPFTFRFHFVINFFSYILIVDQSCFVLCLKKVEIYRKLAERCPLLVPVGIPDVISHYYIRSTTERSLQSHYVVRFTVLQGRTFLYTNLLLKFPSFLPGPGEVAAHPGEHPRDSGHQQDPSTVILLPWWPSTDDEICWMKTLVRDSLWTRKALEDCTGDPPH